MVSVRTAPENVIKPWKLAKQTAYTLYNANIIDPVNGEVHANMVVLLSGGKFDSITKISETESRSCFEHRKVVDCTGKYLCPGLIDCHVHVTTVPGEPTLDTLFNIPPDVSLLRQPFVTNQMLERGFTSIRDCGGAGLALKEAIQEGVIQGPRLFISGHGISQTGGNIHPMAFSVTSG
jgi:imidazolonepropionase-like amidohydrolase